MKTQLIFMWALCLAGALGLSAQSPCAQISYECSTKLGKGPVHNGANTLYFDHEKALFVHNDFPSADKYVEKGTVVAYIKGDSEGLPVFIHLKEKYLYYKSEYAAPPGEIFIFKETLPQIAWTIGTEQKVIGNYQCIAASGTFGGRIYDVWFTPEIPVSLGPYKLGGLPGMILEAASRDGKVIYQFVSYQNSCDRAIERPVKGRDMPWDTFEKFVIGRLLKSEAGCPPTATCTDNDPPADYEIERNKFTIISRYKAKRGDKEFQHYRN
ncbi:MAG: GLPGLI family protein [Saprospiraceae bacterium]|nr:GLPGLI family protein [Saprospiraceae bacterium]